MKAGIVTALIALCLPATVFATSLRLSNDIDLLVLDGKKVSSSLLRGADSIELENGRHQLVFRVEKPFACPATKNVCIFRLRWSSALIPNSSVRLISTSHA